MNISGEHVIGEIVVEDYRAAAVFESFGIDFSGKGHRTINEACADRNILPVYLLEGLTMATSEMTDEPICFQSWRLDLLVDFIEKRHHAYAKKTIPVLTGSLENLCEKYGQEHRELMEIKTLFTDLAEELKVMMKKEELFMFPFIRKMVLLQHSTEKMSNDCFGTIQDPIESMMYEQDLEGLRFMEISRLSNNYNAPANADDDFRDTYKLLREFESDLNFHIRLETDVLFPRAVKMEKSIPGISFGRSL